MSNPASPNTKAEGVRRGAPNARERTTKNFARFMPCNSLISHDSDERIQGNPRKSNAHNGGFCSETPSAQENPNGSTASPCPIPHKGEEKRGEDPVRRRRYSTVTDFARLRG